MPFTLFADLEDHNGGSGRVCSRVAIAAAIEALTRVLLLSGFGMTICGGSYPASQGEHLISHYIEMMGGHDRGRPIAWRADRGHDHLSWRDCRKICLRCAAAAEGERAKLADRVTAHFGNELGHDCMVEIMPKLLNDKQADDLNDRLARIWPSLVGDLRQDDAAGRRRSPRLSDALRCAKILSRPRPFARDSSRMRFRMRAKSATATLSSIWRPIPAGCSRRNISSR